MPAGADHRWAAWLHDLGVDVGEDVQDCGITYHTRYYRQTSTSTLSRIMLPGVRGELEGVLVIGFIGDHGTYGLMIAAAPWDEELKVLRHDWAFDAALAEIPSAAPWAAPENGIPLHSVATMAGHQNVLRHWVSDGEPVVLGVLPVGDSLCTTNPAYGWGASMALTYAFAAVEAICEGGDQRTVALRYHDAVRNEADGVYRESAAMDRTRRYRWNMEPVPEHDADEAERQSLIAEGIMRGALRDPVLGRAFLRRMNLLDAPHEILDDPEVAQHAADMREYYASRPPRKTGPGPGRAAGGHRAAPARRLPAAGYHG